MPKIILGLGLTVHVRKFKIYILIANLDFVEVTRLVSDLHEGSVIFLKQFWKINDVHPEV